MSVSMEDSCLHIKTLLYSPITLGDFPDRLVSHAPWLLTTAVLLRTKDLEQAGVFEESHFGAGSLVGFLTRSGVGGKYGGYVSCALDPTG